MNWFIGNQSFQAGDTLVQMDSNVFEDISNHLRFLENVWEDFFLALKVQRFQTLLGQETENDLFSPILIPDFMQLFEATCFWTQWTQQIKSWKVDEFISKNYWESTFFSVFRFGSGLQWLLLTVGSPTFPGTTSGRRERERARARRAMALSGTRFQGTEGAGGNLMDWSGGTGGVGGFLKWWVSPTNPWVFSTKNDQHLGWRLGVPAFMETLGWS